MSGSLTNVVEKCSNQLHDDDDDDDTLLGYSAV
jgi:hypothetical protein